MYKRYCELRDLKGLTDSQVAEYCEFPKSTFSDWKKGKSTPKIDKLENTEKVIARLSSILLDEMGKEDLTIDEMVDRCGVSKRKFCEIIYKEHKGLYMETFLTICENLHIKYSDIFDIMKKVYK